MVSPRFQYEERVLLANLWLMFEDAVDYKIKAFQEYMND